MENSTTDDNSLNTLIAPEVHHDEFSEAIRNLARSAEIDTVLEIGSSSGEGSTLAWVEGLRKNTRKPKLFCMEVSRVRCEALQNRWGPEGFVECFLGSSVDLDQFPSPQDVERFHRDVPGPLQSYPIDQVLGWLKADIDYINKEGVQTGRIREIKRARGIKNFGAVLIDGSEFTGDAELDEVYGAEFILLDDTQTYKCHAAHHRLLHDPGYELIAENQKLRHGYSIFRRRRRTRLDPLPSDAPVNYFTMVLNGEPFIRHHIEVLRQLSFPWHWHIVEGAATLSHDTAWSTAAGGTLPDDRHRDGLSIDDTSAYLDEIAAAFPANITIYRKPKGRLWDGKIEMVAEPLKHIFHDGILWEIDADELWTAAQLEEGRRMFLRSPEKTAAYFWCDYFVGEKLVISTRNCYSQNPTHEWLRAWTFRPGMKWSTHEPPVLTERMMDGSWRDVASGRVFTHAETEAAGLVFQHYAYATEAQVAFKERYYGYAGAVNAWRNLQSTREFPVTLRDFFPWVSDHTQVDSTEHRQVSLLASRDIESGIWKFSSHLPQQTACTKPLRSIIIDGVFFQFNNTGIGRVWTETLKQWAASEFAAHVWVLDRDGTAPRIPGIKTHRVMRYDPARPDDDARMLQQVCEQLHAGVFISTYYTAPFSTPSVMMVYDMIPELLGVSDGDWQWREKELCILQAREFVCISQSTAMDLRRLHPEIPPEIVSVAPLAAPPEFRQPGAAAIAEFRKQHGLTKDYVMVAGERIGIHIGTQGYKNAALVFKAWSLLPASEKAGLDILCAGGKSELEDELKVLAPDAKVHLVRFTDSELSLAYAGAVALVYPSLYEGFGLPVIEAMACGCPVITCARASLKEVAGDAACFVDPWDAAECATVLQTLRHNTSERSDRVASGLNQAARFSYPKMATELAAILQKVAMEPAESRDLRTKLAWEKLRQIQTSELAFASDVTAMTLEIKNAKKAIKDAAKALKKSEKALLDLKHKVKEERKKRRKPLRRLWDKLRGKR